MKSLKCEQNKDDLVQKTINLSQQTVFQSCCVCFSILHQHSSLKCCLLLLLVLFLLKKINSLYYNNNNQENPAITDTVLSPTGMIIITTAVAVTTTAKLMFFKQQNKYANFNHCIISTFSTCFCKFLPFPYIKGVTFSILMLHYLVKVENFVCLCS